MLSEAPLHVSNVALVDPSDGWVAAIGCCEVCTGTAMFMYITTHLSLLLFMYHIRLLHLLLLHER